MSAGASWAAVDRPSGTGRASGWWCSTNAGGAAVGRRARVRAHQAATTPSPVVAGLFADLWVLRRLLGDLLAIGLRISDEQRTGVGTPGHILSP